MDFGNFAASTRRGSFWCLGCRVSLGRASPRLRLSQDKAPRTLWHCTEPCVPLLCPAGPQLKCPRKLSRAFCPALDGSWGRATLPGLWEEQAQCHPLLWSLRGVESRGSWEQQRGPEAFPFLTSVRVFLLPSYQTKDLNNSP